MANIFGGGNSNALYTPMSEDEMEVISRLVEADDLQIEVIGWGFVNKFTAPGVRFGDARLQLPFKVHFTSPSVAIPVSFLDLELQTRSGLLLHRERMSTVYDGSSLYVGAGIEVSMVWDIQIRCMDPQLVKAIKPGALGLTTREGNRKLNTSEAEILRRLRAAEERNKIDAAKQVAKAVSMSVLAHED